MRMTALRAAVLLLGIANASASTGATSTRFDLECADAGGKDGPYTAHYRIDLSAKKWCEDQCRTVKPISAVQTSYITLEGAPNTEWWHTIDRQKGEDSIFSEIGEMEHISGQCTLKPFSGFATFKTKF